MAQRSANGKAVYPPQTEPGTARGQSEPFCPCQEKARKPLISLGLRAFSILFQVRPRRRNSPIFAYFHLPLRPFLRQDLWQTYLGQMWDYFENSDCTDYKAFLERYFARFIAEEPTFGAACLPSLLRFMEEQDVFGEDETILRYHTKNNPYFDRAYMDYVTHFTQKTLGTFADGKDRLFKYTYIQYEWMRVVFENMRRRIGYCNGLIFWMFNDCWPAALG